jgi:hypothetical protein
MKKNEKKNLSYVIMFLALISSASAIESCYVELEINETKNNEIIEFSMLNLKNLYGHHQGLVNPYYGEADYILRTYDEGSRLMDEYAVSSSRFIFYDNPGEEDLGGVIEADSGTIFATIPYSENINSIKVENEGIETDLNIYPNEIVCERTCKIENEVGDYKTEDCCSGFIQSLQEEDAFICINCGDGVCSENEDPYLCAEDCIQEFTCPEEMFKLTYGCSTKELRFDDWRNGRISLITLMGDIRDSILPSL